MQKDQRVQLVMSEQEVERLRALAEANTGENISMMIRRLVNLAYLMPEALSLHAPKADALTREPNQDLIPA